MSAHFDRDSGGIGAGAWSEEKFGVRGLIIESVPVEGWRPPVALCRRELGGTSSCTEEK